MPEVSDGGFGDPDRRLDSIWDYKKFDEIKIGAYDGSLDDSFGRSVATCGQRVLVGSYLDNYRSVRSGSAYMYEVSETKNWKLRSKMYPSSGSDNDYFGWSVSCESNITVVGAYGHDRQGNEAGAVFIYSNHAQGEISEEATLIASDGMAGDHFGWSVCIHEGVILVGAIGHDYLGVDSGLVYAYIYYISPGSEPYMNDRSFAGAWILESIIFASDGSPYAYYGSSIAMSRDTVAIGAPWTDRRQGSVYLYRRNVTVTQYSNDDQELSYEETRYIPESKLTAPTRNFKDFFGNSVTLSGSYLAIGSYLSVNNNGVNSGSVYVYRREVSSWAYVQKIEPSLYYKDKISYFGFSVSLQRDVLLVGGPGSADSLNSSVHIYEFSQSMQRFERIRVVTSPDLSSNFGVSVSAGNKFSVIGSDRAVGTHSMDQRTGAIYIINAHMSNGGSGASANSLYGDPSSNTTSLLSTQTVLVLLLVAGMLSILVALLLRTREGWGTEGRGRPPLEDSSTSGLLYADDPPHPVSGGRSAGYGARDLTSDTASTSSDTSAGNNSYNVTTVPLGQYFSPRRGGVAGRGDSAVIDGIPPAAGINHPIEADSLGEAQANTSSPYFFRPSPTPPLKSEKGDALAETGIARMDTVRGLPVVVVTYRGVFTTFYWRGSAMSWARVFVNMP